MNSYPLIRNRWSNEHLLAVLFFALSLYQLPDWTSSWTSILRYILLVAAALFLDVAINYIRYSKPVCAVSAAVSAAVLYPVVKELPGWAGLLGIAVALIIGKHIWGGTGKNIFNPAVVSMFLLSMIFPMKLSLFEPSYLLLPALALSLPFLAVRAFPGIGLITGMLLAAFLGNNLTAESFIAVGVIYWGCIVITDPATSTDNPAGGVLLGFLAGFIPMYFRPDLFAISFALLAFNGASYILGRYSNRTKGLSLTGIRIKAPVRTKGEMVDLSGEQSFEEGNWKDLSAQSIMERIEGNGVFGMGGAGFPTVNKLEAFIKSGSKEKYMIINGMECDPGLVHDKWLIQNRQAEIGKGIEVLCRIAGFKSIYYIAKEINGLELPKPVVPKQMPDKYPYGAERIFIKRLLGIDIPAASNPAQYGVLVLNVQTVYAVYQAVCCNKRIDTRYITVADLFAGTSRTVRAAMGSRISDIIEKTVGSKGLAFAGGGIMQAHSVSDGETIGKTTNFIAVGMLPKYKESVQCINCGLCRLCCPQGLDVKRITEQLEAGRLLEARSFGLDRCMGCGTCSYVCLAGKNLSGRMQNK